MTSSSSSMKVITVGYPRIGANREMKKGLEDFWSKKIDKSALLTISQSIFMSNIKEQASLSSASIIGVGSHTLYDHILDWIYRFNIIPKRFTNVTKEILATGDSVDVRFAMARGYNEITALDMTKWFDTNYHNLTPEIDDDVLKNMTLDNLKLDDFTKMIKDASAEIGSEKVGAEIVGPLTMAMKANLGTPSSSVTVEKVVRTLTPLYKKLFETCKSMKVGEVQVSEPALILEAAAKYKDLMTAFYNDTKTEGLNINLVTFYDDIGEAFPWVVALPNVTAVSLDFTRGESLELLKKHSFPSDKRLGAGVVDGRSIWKDVALASKIIKDIKNIVPATTEITVQTSCSLLHCPYDVQSEAKLDAKIKATLSFARQKLADLKVVATSAPGAATGGLDKAVTEDEVKEPEASLVTRSIPFTDRRKLQLGCLSGLLFPTSTIGSFPQIPAMRKIRLQYRKGEVSEAEYFKAVDQYIAYCIGVQDGIGLDILVHGEPERSDMVEYFAEKMDGFLFTQNGWVQSYGSRYVRPPVIYADVARTGNKPMTVREFIVAQDCTEKPVKGMLTGPTTILAWSFPRKDISRKAQAFQIAYALRDEVADLETAGCSVIQVDEPALRETLPIKSKRWKSYLDGSVKAFKLTTTVCKPETHVVSHFCYSEFGDVMQAIKDFDADQITIENSRSDDVVLKFLVSNKYSHDVAPGVYDVHSPIVPPQEKIFDRLQMIINSGLEKDKIWIVPDCGLKTRKWNEVIPSLRNVVQAVEQARKQQKK